MQDKKCIYNLSECIPKGVSKDIKILINGDSSINTFSKNSDFNISVDYIGTKKVTSITKLNGEGSYVISMKRDGIFPEENLFRHYNKAGEYNLVVFLHLEDGSTIYNMKNIIVIK